MPVTVTPQQTKDDLDEDHSLYHSSHLDWLVSIKPRILIDSNAWNRMESDHDGKNGRTRTVSKMEQEQTLHIDFEFDLAADYAHCIHPHLHAAVEGIIYASPSDDTTRESEAASTRRTFIPHQFNAYDYGYAHAQTQKNSSTHPLIKLALFALLLINLVNQE